MSGQWSLLALIAAVASGLATVAVSAAFVRSRQTAFLRYFLIQILLFNLLILAGFVIQFVDLQLRQQGVQPHAALLPGLLAALAVLKLGWLAALIAMLLVLPGQELPAGFARRLAAGTALFFGIWAALLATAVASRSGGAVNALLVLMELAVLGGATAACIHLLVRAASLPPGPRRRTLTVLGGIYIGVFVVMIGSLAPAWLRPSGQTPAWVLFSSTLMTLYNLLSLAWILRYEPFGPMPTADAMERYGITPREREIIEEISAGRTNQEIADRLFVSLATVKDHVYNIFRKTGVRNRVELANLMRTREGGGGNRTA